MPTTWLKIPKSVNVTDFPLEQLLSTWCTWPKCVVTPRRSSGRWTFLVEILSSCCGRGGCHWHFLAPFLTCIIPRADSHTIICTVRQRHRYKFGNVLPVMAGDCGDEIPSKSNLQSAGITSSANPANLLVIR